MQSIFIMVVMIVIMVASFGSPTKVNFNSVKVKLKTGDVRSSFIGMSTNWRNYQMEFGETLPLASWKANIQSSGLNIPDYPSYTWSYGQNVKGYYFCLKSNSTTVINSYWHEVLVGATATLGGSAFVNEDCGAIVDFAAAQDLSTLTSLSFTGYLGG
jgi:hypothetical protein